MGTYFFQSGRENDAGLPVVWFGRAQYAYPALNDLRFALLERGIVITDICD